MNGRVYAPEISRFLSADPFMQFPESTQGLNRYSYVANNPLSYTDPSGFGIWDTLSSFMSPITERLMQSDTMHSIGMVALNYVPYCQVWCAAVANGIRGYMMTGSESAATKSAAYTAASAGIAYGIGTAFGDVSSWQGQLGKAVAHGVAQGALTQAGGGRFGDGFLGGFASSLAGPYIEEQHGSGVEGVIIAAVIGGTVAEIGGGKFANGAISAAFVYMFNEAKHKAEREKEEAYKLALVAERPNASSTFGHVFVGGVKPDGSIEAYGFYPTEGNLGALYEGDTLKGVIRDDTILFKQALKGNNNFKIKMYTVDQATYYTAIKYIQNYDQMGDYGLFTNSCVDAVFNTFGHAGIINSRSVPALHPTSVYEAIDSVN